VDLREDELECAIHERVHLLRIDAFGERSRVREVGEQDGDVFALAFESGFLGEDLLCQGFGGVGAWIRKSGAVARAARGRFEGETASVAETGLRRVDPLARVAANGERSATIVAEASRARILVIARVAVHGA
jgi:hypothetical protein